MAITSEEFANYTFCEGKGDIMQATSLPQDIDQLLAEADELIKQVNSNAIRDTEEEHRVQFEKHAQSLKKLRAEVQEKIDKQGTPEGGAYSEGMHQAIDEIVTAMKNVGSYFS
jgi:Spy/CpxP family protein refolding chaperone